MLIAKIAGFLAVPGLLFFLLDAQASVACEPCDKELSLEETADTADLVIVGQRTDYSADETNPRMGGPPTVNVQVISVLKGLDPGATVTVAAWAGMCDYGIVVDDKTYLMFLQKNEPKAGNFAPLYGSVNDGCAAKAILIEGGYADNEGIRVPVAEFARGLGLKEPVQVRQGGAKGGSGVAGTVFLLLILVTLAAVVIALRKVADRRPRKGRKQ